MTKSRRASASKRYTPELEKLAGAGELELRSQQFEAEYLAALKDDSAKAMMAGRTQAMVIKCELFFEHAFERIATLEAALKKAKAAPLPYQGAWQQGTKYEAGSFVSYAGSLWHVNKASLSRPGDDPGAFTLAVKRGQDGKGAQP